MRKQASRPRVDTRLFLHPPQSLLARILGEPNNLQQNLRDAASCRLLEVLVCILDSVLPCGWWSAACTGQVNPCPSQLPLLDGCANNVCRPAHPAGGGGGRGAGA